MNAIQWLILILLGGGIAIHWASKKRAHATSGPRVADGTSNGISLAGKFYLGSIFAAIVLIAAFGGSGPAPHGDAQSSTPATEVATAPAPDALASDKVETSLPVTAKKTEKEAAQEASEATSSEVREAEHMVAALINLNGHLCAQVVNVEPLKVSEAAFEVTCIQYRGGSGRVRYLVDGARGLASPL